MLTILDGDGEEMFQVKLGEKPTSNWLANAMSTCCYAKVTGLELEECLRLLGRPKFPPGVHPHTFSNEATEEILLNWGL